MATYTSFSELKGKQLEKGDEVQFTIKEDKLFYTVNDSFLVDSAHTSNAIIFKKLNISDKNKYASLIYGYSVVDGKGEYSWPEFRENDYKAATKLVCDLFKKCESMSSSKDSLYKIGDRVIVKSQFDTGYREFDYPCTFTKEMLQNFGGKEVTISEVITLMTDYKDRKGYVEDYKYKIKEDCRVWYASMFVGKIEEKSKSFKDSGFSFTKKDIPENCPYHPYVIDQALVEYSKGIEPAISNLKEGFEHCISHTVSSWFTWKETSQGSNYWNYLADHSHFIPKNYIPTYFIEEISVDTEDLVEYYKKDVSDAITCCSSRTSHNSIEIPCSYEEVTLSIKKKKVHF